MMSFTCSPSAAAAPVLAPAVARVSAGGRRSSASESEEDITAAAAPAVIKEETSEGEGYVFTFACVEDDTTSESESESESEAAAEGPFYGCLEPRGPLIHKWHAHYVRLDHPDALQSRWAKREALYAIYGSDARWVSSDDDDDELMDGVPGLSVDGDC